MKKRNLQYLNKLFINQQLNFKDNNKKGGNDKKKFYGKRGSSSFVSFHENIKNLLLAIQVYDRINYSKEPVLFIGSKKPLGKLVGSLKIKANHTYAFNKWSGGCLTNKVDASGFSAGNPSLGLLFGYQESDVILAEIASIKSPVIAIGDHFKSSHVKMKHGQLYPVYSNERGFKSLWFFLYIFLNKLK